MPQLFHFVAEQFKESLMLGGQSQHMVAGRLCQYLKPWQLEGLRFLYKNHEKGESCILNDESGLGKVVTVSTFLGSVLTNDTTKKCLIVVRDEEAIDGWRFHLSVLTHLTVKVIEKTTDINFETVFLIKWSTLKNICEIDKVNFDHIIVDNRGEILDNKFCTGILLRYFENKTTIIISSVDVTSDIKLLHILLRLCGRLDRQFVDVKEFENKFQLPQLQEGVSKKVDLEDYFLKREKVINFCREFRLRRYCHQFDEEFPIVPRNEFQKHLEQWKNQNKNSLSSGSVKLLSSSSEKDTEELFKEYFQFKKERDLYILDNEVQRINQNQEQSVIDYEDAANSSDDVVVMSPLLLVSESESESDDDQTQIENNQRDSQFIEEIKDVEDVIGKTPKNTTKDSENTSLKNRRKSKTPIKTPTRSNIKNNILLNDSKNLRSRALLSPKRPLPIRTKSRKSLEADKLIVDGAAKPNKERKTGKRLNHQESITKVSQKDEQKTKVDKDTGNRKVKQTLNKQETTLSEKDKEEKRKKLPSADKSVPSIEKQKKQNISNEKPPEKSSKQKDNEAGKGVELGKLKTIHNKPKQTMKSKMNSKSLQEKSNEKQETMKPPTSEEKPKKPEKTTLIQSEKDIQIATDPKNSFPTKNKRKEKVISKKKTPTINLMLEEAQKFVKNKNIGRRSKNAETTKRSSKAIAVPIVSIITEENTEKPRKSISISKRTENLTETSKQSTTNNNTKPETPRRYVKKFSELTPLGVHAISTRGMQRQTRSNRNTSKYMKVAVAQVGIDKKSSPKTITHRRGSVVFVRKALSKRKIDKVPTPTPSVISDSPVESIQLGQALTPTNGSVVPDFIAPAPRDFGYHFPLMLDRETSDSECQIASQNGSNHEVIILTGSSTNDREMEPPKSTVSRRKPISKPPMVTIHRPIFSKAKSPDLFSTCSEVSLPCSQQHTNKSNFEGFKIFGSELRQPSKPRSCLDILERMLEPKSGIVAGVKNTPTTQEKPKHISHQHCVEDEDAMFEITSNGTFGNTVRINSNGEMSPMRNKNQSTPPPSGHPKNRITNYLISNTQHTSILAQPSPLSLEDINELLPKTPKRRKSLSGILKRSPRSLAAGVTGGKSQSTKLTQWLVKNSTSQINKESATAAKPQSSKRRRLELSFPDK